MRAGAYAVNGVELRDLLLFERGGLCNAGGMAEQRGSAECTIVGELLTRVDSREAKLMLHGG